MIKTERVWILALGLLLETCAFSTWATTNTSFVSRPQSEQIALIEHLLDNNLGFSEEVSFDDVLQVEEPMLSHYRQQDDLRHLFQFKELVIYILASRGEVVKASDKCRVMLSEAESIRYTPGIALAHFALGDVYLNCTMNQEAMKEYEAAYNLLSSKEEERSLVELVLLQQIPLYLRIGEYDKADKRIKEMEQLYRNPDSHLNEFLLYCFRTYYYIATNRRSEAAENLRKAEDCFASKPSPYYELHLLFARADYARLTGNYVQAAHTYAEIVHKAQHSGIHLRERMAGQLLVEHHRQIGDYREACRIIRGHLAERDSLITRNYASQVNLLRAIYQIDNLNAENNAQRLYLLYGAVAGVFVLLLIACILLWFYRQANHRLALSQQQLEKARQTAENSIRTKSLFLSNMSHEIRTPLNALAGFSTILEENHLDEETRRQCSEIISQNSELLQKLFSDIVDLSNIEIGKMQFSYDTYEAVAICRNVVETVERIKQTSAGVSFQTSLKSLPLYTDKGRLQQVLFNLLVNATKFTTEGDIRLRLEKDASGDALFEVEDTGCGIPLDKQGAIFNRFEKLNENAQGSGLGLSICQLIIERFGGRIWIDSTYTGGTRFCFTHPTGSGERKEVAP